VTEPDDQTGWDDPHDGAFDSRIADLSRAHPFWDYERLAEALASDGIYVSAIYVAWRKEVTG
jgi:hypothetical protein